MAAEGKAELAALWVQQMRAVLHTEKMNLTKTQPADKRESCQEERRELFGCGADLLLIATEKHLLTGMEQEPFLSVTSPHLFWG